MKPLSIWSVLVLLSILIETGFPEAIFHQRGQHTKTVQKPTNVVNSREKAEEILQRYGYLGCTAFKRRKHGAKRNRAGKQKNNNHKAKVHSLKHCTMAELREAIRNYQRQYNMPETGKLDRATMKIMSASRCGNPDNEIGITPIAASDVSNVKADKSRQKRAAAPAAFMNNTEIEGSLVPRAGEAEGSLILRKRWAESYVQKLRSGEIEKTLDELHKKVQIQRKKRDARMSDEDAAISFFPDIITWRLVSDGYSNQFTIDAQRTALALAFRMWSEVIPRVFTEDIKSSVNDVDILIAFGRGEHMNCPNDFDGYGGQLSHAIRQDVGAEIHVDDDEHFTTGSEQGTNLLKVAVHEVGHVLGLIHTQRNYSIMYAIYSQVIANNNFELGWEDRKLVQSVYGICNGGFDTVFDWLRTRPDGELIYNTYFFRDDHYWMYENRYNRTRYGDPLQIHPEWKGIPDDINGFAHVWTHTQDVVYFFKGARYWQYDSVEDRASSGYPRNITEDFRRIPGTKYPNIPGDIDTVFFDRRDGNLYFFKENLVYGYNVSKGQDGCCLPGYPKSISKEFPNALHSKPLPRNLDAAYYSYTDKQLYFFKGRQYWVNAVFNPLDRRRTNLVRGPFFTHEKWYDICDAEFF